MNVTGHVISSNPSAIPNGSGAAAILSAGIGAFALAILALVGDKSALIAGILVFYKPTGPLSGVTTITILIWIFTWGILEWRWRSRTVAMGRINAVAFALLALGLLMTFPPIVGLF